MRPGWRKLSSRARCLSTQTQRRRRTARVFADSLRSRALRATRQILSTEEASTTRLQPEQRWRRNLEPRANRSRLSLLSLSVGRSTALDAAKPKSSRRHPSQSRQFHSPKQRASSAQSRTAKPSRSGRSGAETHEANADANPRLSPFAACLCFFSYLGPRSFLPVFLSALLLVTRLPERMNDHCSGSRAGSFGSQCLNLLFLHPPPSALSGPHLS